MLAGVTIVDLTMFVAGPFATMILADLGATVIKIEPPTGDPTRSNRIGAQIGGENAQFHSYNRNKKSVCLNLKSERGRAILLDLVRRADAVVENFRPGVMTRLGLDFATLAAANPRLSLVSLSAFGQDGPWAQRPGYDLLVQALSGAMSINGHAQCGPAHIPFHIGDTGGGIYAAIAVLGAITSARASGQGRHVEIAMLDAQIALLGDEVTNFGVDGHTPRAHGGGHPALAPYQAFMTADQPIAIAAVGVEKFWRNLCAAIGRPDLAADPRYADNGTRAAHREALAAELAPILRARPRAEWLEILARADVPAAPVLDIPDALASEQLRHRDMAVRLAAGAGEALVARTPIKPVNAAHAEMVPAPRLGEHTREILARVLGYDEARIAAAGSGGAFS
jgi:crotonobetainyl-CoA:carnitine CoA-transferase CaiB-like acyl-CoA transferase